MKNLPNSRGAIVAIEPKVLRTHVVDAIRMPGFPIGLTPIAGGPSTHPLGIL